MKWGGKNTHRHWLPNTRIHYSDTSHKILSLGQWLWHSWQSSRLQHQEDPVRIQPSVKFIERWFTANCLDTRKNKEKEAGNGPVREILSLFSVKLYRSKNIYVGRTHISLNLIIRGCLDSWVVSHSALNIGTLSREFEPQWRQTLLLSIWFYLVYLIWYYYVSVKFVMWIVKQKISLYLISRRIQFFQCKRLIWCRKCLLVKSMGWGIHTIIISVKPMMRPFY